MRYRTEDGSKERAFAEACIHHNTLPELVTALRNPPSRYDLHVFNLDATGYYVALEDAVERLTEMKGEIHEQ